MVIIAKRHRNRASRTCHADFERILPQIREQARLAFRYAQPELKEELIAEVVANTFCAYQRLVERGKAHLAYATPLAQYAIKQIRCGRRVGSKLNNRDISSRYAQLCNGITVERLNGFDPEEGEWHDTLVEDRRAGPADTAAARIDVATWFRSLRPRDRRIAQTLATGETTRATARKFGVTDGRVSQLRRELEASWSLFQGEPVVA
jgi:hypothetical protein